mmetsp:Transcript_37605/g.91246  ORF Transcript_37605/g.91246 Transcript_37605/m.91246 type:complete len:490 (-) Transcript_37605:148-1617(-)
MSAKNEAAPNQKASEDPSNQRRQTRIIRAVYTDTTVRVYQAYNDQIADAAVEAQSFRGAMEKGLWSPSRMTWIKPSAVWMAYRCGWTKLKDANQARVLALDLDRTKFEEILDQAVLSTSVEGRTTKKCRNQGVVVQWDPERVIDPNAPPNQVFTQSTQNVRSIQIGLRRPANECLLDTQTVVRITDVTQQFRSALGAIQDGRSWNEIEALLWPDGQSEELLSVPSHIVTNLGITTTMSKNSNINDPEVAVVTTNKEMRKEAVVVLGCTANPPHRGHLHCIQAAQAFAEQTLGYKVLFSTIAVAPYGYVKRKCEGSSMMALDDATRLDILRLMMNAQEDIMRKQETLDGHGLRFQAPLRTFGSALECGRALRPSPDVTVIVVVGGDRFKWTNKPNHPDLVTLCCARSNEQYTELEQKMAHDLHAGKVSGDPSRWQLLSTVGPPTSSTMIRSILMDKQASLEQKQNALKEHGYPEEAVEMLLSATKASSKE